MSNQEKPQRDESRARETGDEQRQGTDAIEDLSPNDRRANDVRGGILPPDESRIGILSPTGTSTVYVLPPND